MAKCESLVQMQNTHWPDQGSPWEEKAIIKKKSFHVILFPPLEKAVNRVKLMAVGVRCNLGRDPPGAEEENACTTMCSCPSNWEKGFRPANLLGLSCSTEEQRQEGEILLPAHLASFLHKQNMIVVVKSNKTTKLCSESLITMMMMDKLRLEDLDHLQLQWLESCWASSSENSRRGDFPRGSCCSWWSRSSPPRTRSPPKAGHPSPYPASGFSSVDWLLLCFNKWTLSFVMKIFSIRWIWRYMYVSMSVCILCTCIFM